MQGEGYCECGCGQSTTLYRGQRRRFVTGHNRRKPVRWVEEDRGYLTPCWIWQLRKSTEGYGNEGLEARSAHRTHYEARYGAIDPGLVIDHLCGVPSCVNPEHLEPVTQAENVRRGRGTRLTTEQVDEIRSRLARGVRQRDVAEAFGIDKSHVSRINTGRRWA